MVLHPIICIQMLFSHYFHNCTLGTALAWGRASVEMGCKRCGEMPAYLQIRAAVPVGLVAGLENRSRAIAEQPLDVDLLRCPLPLLVVSEPHFSAAPLILSMGYYDTWCRLYQKP